MDSSYKSYDYLTSFARLDAILTAPSGNYEEVDSLPDRDKLTFTNGFYANCSALFIDIRDSSTLPSSYKRPALAKIYRSFISEMVAVFNSGIKVREVNIVGDCVWGVYNSPYKTDIEDVLGIAACANSLTMVLNYKLKKQGFTTPLKFGIGMSYGRALMIKAGYSGSGINDVIYMGDVVNRAAKLAAQGSKNWAPPMIVDETFYDNLEPDYRQWFTRQYGNDYYQGTVVNTLMNDWYEANCT
ncbi:adenylate/guanylate cyclase domain-containing protein [Microlunatus aurantiacus]|uniref:Adenylate/guanylate cyclase domain-containing protein n=1 Tax=Microlunatus aurantiacus TaxID=446786 RepID=A0ABP7D517_9ACTN